MGHRVLRSRMSTAVSDINKSVKQEYAQPISTDLTKKGSTKPIMQAKSDRLKKERGSYGEAKGSGDEDTTTKDRKKSQYGIELGISPYPERTRPTAEDCRIVFEILKQRHGTEKSKPPEDFNVPSRTVAGCGNVKFLLEALIRTKLSAHTSFSNANKAWEDLGKTFPRLTEGSCVNFLDWNAVRLAPIEELEKAIHRGGMAPTKSMEIRSILDMVYEENKLLRKAWYHRENIVSSDIKLEVGDQDDNAVPFKFDVDLSRKTLKNGQCRRVTIDIQQPMTVLEKASCGEDSGNKDVRMAQFFKNTLLNEPNVLTLDYFHAMDDNEAFYKLLKYPGIGVKTAACVMLFSKQRPFFAVDTHVHRISRWLGWTPKNASRDAVFAHVNVRCPDELKYGLHQLMIEHGKLCPKCRKQANASSLESKVEAEADDERDDSETQTKKLKSSKEKGAQRAVCPLEDLLDRFDQTTAAERKRKKTEVDQEQTGDDDIELPVKRKKSTTDSRNLKKTKGGSKTKPIPKKTSKSGLSSHQTPRKTNIDGDAAGRVFTSPPALRTRRIKSSEMVNAANLDNSSDLPDFSTDSGSVFGG